MRHLRQNETIIQYALKFICANFLMLVINGILVDLWRNSFLKVIKEKLASKMWSLYRNNPNKMRRSVYHSRDQSRLLMIVCRYCPLDLKYHNMIGLCESYCQERGRFIPGVRLRLVSYKWANDSIQALDPGSHIVLQSRDTQKRMPL